MALEPMMPSLDDYENPELTDFRRRFWWTLPLSLIVLALAMIGHRWSFLSREARTRLEFALSAPVVLWAGWPFFQRWAQSIANRSPNMWTLIGTGVGAAFGYSLVATVAPDLFPESFREHGRVGVYFEAAAIIVSLTLLGQLLELTARSSTSAIGCAWAPAGPVGICPMAIPRRSSRVAHQRPVDELIEADCKKYNESPGTKCIGSNPSGLSPDGDFKQTVSDGDAWDVMLLILAEDADNGLTVRFRALLAGLYRDLQLR
jgi:hypothetical protein